MAELSLSNVTMARRREKAKLKEPDLFAAPEPAPDARGQLWTTGIPIVRTLTGKSDGKARSLLGKLCRDADDDCAGVLAVLIAAQDARPMDPVPWLVAAVAARKAPRNGFLGMIRDEGMGRREVNPVLAFLERPNVH